METLSTVVKNELAAAQGNAAAQRSFTNTAAADWRRNDRKQRDSISYAAERLKVAELAEIDVADSNYLTRALIGQNFGLLGSSRGGSSRQWRRERFG